MDELGDGFGERLYLLKTGTNDIYIDDSQLLQQHQVDGLRFLFKQFFKKSPGVIVNFPESCGKTATVILFIKAVHSMLKYPILILYNHDQEIEHWKESLKSWTSYDEDSIAVDHLNPYVKEKKIFLKKPANLNSYLRRRWSIVVVKEDIVNKDTIKLVFEADFKIWLTSTDVKKDLLMLSQIYSWINPKEKINFNNLIPKGNTLKEKFKKAVQLDAAIEDFVIRENLNIQPSEMTLKTAEVVSNDTKRPKRSIKNKDATGTKIKRSKKNVDVNTTHKNNNKEKTEDNLSKENEILSNEIVNKTEKTENELSKVIFGVEAIKQEINSAHLNENDHESPIINVESYISEHKQLQFPIITDDLSIYNKENNKKELCDSPNIAKAVNEPEQSTESLSFDSDKEIDKSNDKAQSHKVINDDTKVNCEGIDNITKESSSKFKGYLIGNELQDNVTDIIKTDEITDNISKLNKDELVLKEKDDTIKCEENDIDIDRKITEMEEKALKKFKGSLLDSIF